MNVEGILCSEKSIPLNSNALMLFVCSLRGSQRTRPSQNINETAPFFSLVINNLYLINARGQTGKGANLILFGGAITAMCSGRTKRVRLSFPVSFSLVHLTSSSSQKKVSTYTSCFLPCSVLLEKQKNRTT
jgi:hypothetical protein